VPPSIKLLGSKKLFNPKPAEKIPAMIKKTFFTTIFDQRGFIPGKLTKKIGYLQS